MERKIDYVIILHVLNRETKFLLIFGNPCLSMFNLKRRILYYVDN
jgi:hypothetical protein